MKRASYKFGVEWIAKNDESEETEIEFIKYQISTLLLADLFERDPKEVAKDILKKRLKQLKDLK